MTVLLLWFKVLGTLVEISFNVINDFILFQVFLILFLLDSFTFTLQFLTHTVTVPILHGLKILMLFNRLLYYKKNHQNNIISALKLSFKFFFRKNNILEFSDKTMIDNILFISQTLSNMPPPSLKAGLSSPVIFTTMVQLFP